MDGGSRLARALAKVGDVVTPAEIRTLRELAKESRLAALSAFPDAEALIHAHRRRASIRNPFVEETIKHLALFDDLARFVEERLAGFPARLRRMPRTTDDVRHGWESRAEERVEADDVRMLRRLAHEARLLLFRARSQSPRTPAAARRSPKHRRAFLADAIRHLELLDELARLVERQLWDE